jgi:hypothetical protein
VGILLFPLLLACYLPHTFTPLLQSWWMNFFKRPQAPRDRQGSSTAADARMAWGRSCLSVMAISVTVRAAPISSDAAPRAPGRLAAQLQLSIVVGRPRVLDFPRSAPRRVHDLHRRRTRRRLRRPHMRHQATLYGPGLVRNSTDREQRTPRSAPYRRVQGETWPNSGQRAHMVGGGAEERPQ